MDATSQHDEYLEGVLDVTAALSDLENSVVVLLKDRCINVFT
jgi:hypothetical protein